MTNTEGLRKRLAAAGASTAAFTCCATTLPEIAASHGIAAVWVAVPLVLAEAFGIVWIVTLAMRIRAEERNAAE